MTITEELKRELDAIDWEAPAYLPPSEQEFHRRNREEDSDLYEFITEMAELITDAQEWRRFTAAFRRYSNTRDEGQ